MSNPESAPENKIFSLQNIISVLCNMNEAEVREQLEELIFYLSDNKTTLGSALKSDFDLKRELEDFFYQQIEYGTAYLKIPLQFGDEVVDLKIEARIGQSYHITLESYSKSSEIKQRWNNIPQVKERNERVNNHVKMWRDIQENPCWERSSYYIEIEHKEAHLEKNEEGELYLQWRTFRHKGCLNKRFTEWITDQLDFIFQYSKEGVPIWGAFELPKIIRIYESAGEYDLSW